MYWLTKKAIDVIKGQLIDSDAENPYISLAFHVKGKTAELSIKTKEWGETIEPDDIRIDRLQLRIPSWIDVKEFSKDSEENSYWLPLTAFIACCEAINGEKEIKIDSEFDYDTHRTRFEISCPKSGFIYVVNRKWSQEEDVEEENDD